MAKTCNSCGDNLTKITMSSASFEAMENRHERREKRLIGLIAFLVALLVATNVGWLIYESQFEVVETTNENTTIEATQDGKGTNIVGGGDVNYGTES